MGTQAKTPVGSRWMLARETKGRVFIVVERMAFGKVHMVQEGRPALSTDATVKQLTDEAQWVRQPGTAELPGCYRTVAAH